MALTPSELTLQIKSQGIKQAADDLKSLAEAAKSVDAETRSFVIAQAKLQEAQTKTKETTKQTSQAVIEQKRDYETWRMSGSRIFLQQQRDVEMWKAGVTKAAAEASAALKQYNETQKEYANLWKEMDTRKGLEQAQQYKLYTMEVAKAAAATKEAEKITKAHGDALEMNKKIDAERAKQLARSTAEQEKHNRQLEEGTKRGSIFNNTLKSMAVAASAYISVNFAKGLFESADAWSMMQAKLSLATGGMQSAKVVQEELYQTAQRIRVPLEDTAKLYNRLVQPLMMMGKTSKDTTDMVSSMGYALKLSGATGQEAASAMLQFSQSMNAGRLNGGEFNSIAEASPNILRAIEAELVRTGKGAELTSKGLKKMAADGQLTAELVSNAMLRALPKWRKDFESLPLTVDGALVRIKNMWEKSIGNLAQDSGFAQNFTKLLGQLEEAIPAFAKMTVSALTTIIEYAGTVVKTLTAITGIGLASWGYSALWGKNGLLEGMSLLDAATLGWKKSIESLKSPIATILGSPTAIIAGITAAVWLGKQAFDAYQQSKNKALTLAEGAEKAQVEYMDKLKAETSIMIKQVNLLREKHGVKERLYDPYEVVKESTGQKELLDRTQERVAAEKELIVAKESVAKAEKIAKAAEVLAGLNPARLLLESDLHDRKKMVAEAQKKLNDLTYREVEIKQILKNQESVRAEQTKTASNERHNNAVETLKQLTQEKDKADDVYKSTMAKIEAYKQSGAISEQEASFWAQSAKKLRDANKEYTESIDDVNKKLGLKARISAITSAEVLAQQEKEQKGVDQYSTTIDNQLKTVDEQISKTLAYINTTESKNISVIDAAIVEAEAQKVSQNGILMTATQIVKTQEYIDKLKTLRRLQMDKDAKDEHNSKIEAEAKKYESLYQSANKKISDGLYAAIGRGGGSAIKKLIQDVKEWFARLVLNPIIQPIAQIGASIISPNAASATSLTSSLSNIGSGISSTFNFLSDPVAWGAKVSASIASGISAVGSTIGSGFLSSVGAGMSGMGIAQASAAGVSSSAGFSIGSGLSSITPYLPYLAAAGLLYKGLSMGDKQITGQTVTGNLGTDNLSRNVSWKQEGGFLRSDRSDTWRYGLKDSTAIQDGKSYVDTANLTADKALLNQLNSAYDSLKQNTASLAKSLGVSSEVILKRNDSISFAFGKDSQETSSNITKAFENVANVMATDLLKGFETLAKVGETSYQTLTRLVTTIGGVNDIFGMLGFKLYDISAEGVKSADALVTLFGGLEKFQAITKSYYDNFYTEAEKTKKSLGIVKDAIKSLGVKEDINTREEYRALVDREKVKGNDALVKSLMELSSAFASVVQWEDSTTTAANTLEKTFETAKQAFEDLSKDAERWLNIRTQAASLKDSIDSTLGNPKKDPAARMKKLWDAMSSDISPEQKLSLANELKDLIVDKYQVEKEGIQKLIDFGKQLRGYTDSLKLGNLSPLTTTQKLAEAQKQFQDTLNKAMGGDTTAQGALTGKADAYLQLAQTAYASSGAYTSIFENVTGALDALGLSSMSAEDKTLAIAQTQADELLKLRDYAANMELLSDSYYKTNLSLLAEQTGVLSKLYEKMGVFDGIATNLAALPAEIAANLSEIMGGNSSGDYITSLYNSLAGKSGDMIDKQGYDYWTNELNVYGKDWVNRSFLESVKVVTGGGVAGIQPRTDNVEVVAQLAAVKEELVALRTEAAKQTGDLIVATYDANSANATAVVEGTTESLQASAWAANTTPSLI